MSMNGVSLGPTRSDSLDALYHEAESAAGSVALALGLVGGLETSPLPGQGSTLRLWETLATIAAADLTVARTAEPHLDALAILAQAGIPAPKGTWGVFAAEGPGARLTATNDDVAWRLDGRKPWCSLASRLDHAVVTAHVGDNERRAFTVDLRQDGVDAVPGTWASRGLSAVDSGAVDFEKAAAQPVGDNNWYLSRDGFAWGGIGVAACWYGGTVGVARRLFFAAAARKPDQIALMHLGHVDAWLFQARTALVEAAALVDSGDAAARR
ncbi:acyl-CoA dehydrogenase, partial [Arthrobacter sp. H5]|uniref:acyl-CoA dehydrogenase n=1 Tax=Arthrobacter sp. H5 TaxID=1267973 RepID=UPI00068516D2